MNYIKYCIRWQDQAGHIYFNEFDDYWARYKFESDLIYINCKVLNKFERTVIL